MPILGDVLTFVESGKSKYVGLQELVNSFPFISITTLQSINGIPHGATAELQIQGSNIVVMQQGSAGVSVKYKNGVSDNFFGKVSIKNTGNTTDVISGSSANLFFIKFDTPFISTNSVATASFYDMDQIAAGNLEAPNDFSRIINVNPVIDAAGKCVKVYFLQQIQPDGVVTVQATDRSLATQLLPSSGNFAVTLVVQNNTL